MKFFKIYFLITLLLMAGATNAKAETYGEYLSTLKDIPSFEQFKVSVANISNTKKLKLSKEDGSWTYRTRLRDAYKEQPNFAGKYVLESIGCGSGCQTNFVLNKETGKVVGNFYSTLGTEYKLDSRLLIVNPVISDENTPLEEVSLVLDVSYYELKNNKLVLIKQINKDSIENRSK